MPKVTGRERVEKRIQSIGGEQTIREVGQALFVGASKIVGETAHLITEGSVSGKNHIPSLPGEPPNENTGVLRSHLEATQTGPLSAEASNNALYAVPLEAGTSKMVERPSMGPATRLKRNEIVADVAAAVNRGIARA